MWEPRILQIIAGATHLGNQLASHAPKIRSIQSYRRLIAGISIFNRGAPPWSVDYAVVKVHKQPKLNRFPAPFASNGGASGQCSKRIARESRLRSTGTPRRLSRPISQTTRARYVWISNMMTTTWRATSSERRIHPSYSLTIAKTIKSLYSGSWHDSLTGAYSILITQGISAYISTIVWKYVFFEYDDHWPLNCAIQTANVCDYEDI